MVRSQTQIQMHVSQVWWHTPVILALRRLRQEDFGFEANLGYRARPVSKYNA